MKSNWVNIQTFQSSEYEIHLPGNLISQYNEAEFIQHGLIKLPLAVKEVEEETDELQNGTELKPYTVLVSSALIKKMFVIEGLPYRMLMNDQTLKLGPVTGILVRNDRFTRKRRKPDIYSRLGGLFAVITLELFSPEEGFTKGKVYHNKKWVETMIPLPEVLFVRCAMSKKRRKTILKEYNERGGLVFNSNVYNKLIVETKVGKTKGLESNIIQSVELKSKKDVLSELDRLGDIIVKPKNGKKGSGIFFVKKVDETYHVYDYRGLKRCNYSVFSKREFLTFLKTINFKSGRYLAQEWVKFIKKNGRPFDLRVYVQKRDQDKWVCSGMMARVAGKKQKITNRSKGGSFFMIDKVFSGYPKSKKQELVKKVSDFCERFCYALDETFPNDHFADVGMDVGIDKNEKVRFMEVNFIAQYQTIRFHDPELFNNLCWLPFIHATEYQGFAVGKQQTNQSDLTKTG
ncbi:YheC/YheD family protein [Alteribacter keqinensis]|uniref:YheC/YheD family protein n=1 Tax=Alteribacter keqinensis TaxID=2483800 RepID=A0A3M7TQ34_9BACI|nr:YheC/YheD family protein [Alteribacter keqinensis]RNA66789.1 hypothetical protein EBO34_16410 [Alteribacter keqinensis]